MVNVSEEAKEEVIRCLAKKYSIAKRCYKDCKNANDSDDVCDFHKDVSILCEHLIKYIDEYN